HFGARRDTSLPACAHDLDADASIAVEDQACRAGLLENGQVGAASHRVQEGVSSIPAHAALLVDLEISATEVVAAVGILDRRNADGGRGGTERIEDVPRKALFLDAPFVARPVQRIGAAAVVLVLLEIRQHIVPRPSRICTVSVPSTPAVVVLLLAAHVDHSVD